MSIRLRNFKIVDKLFVQRLNHFEKICLGPLSFWFLQISANILETCPTIVTLNFGNLQVDFQLRAQGGDRGLKWKHLFGGFEFWNFYNPRAEIPGGLAVVLWVDSSAISQDLIGLTTDVRHVKALLNSLQTISYLGVIWKLYVLGLESKVFCKKQPNTPNHWHETHSPRMGTVVRLKIPKMPLHFSTQFVCPKVTKI